MSRLRFVKQVMSISYDIANNTGNYAFVCENQIYGISNVSDDVLNRLVSLKRDVGCNAIHLSNNYVHHTNMWVLDLTLEFSDKRFMASKLRFPTEDSIRKHIAETLTEIA